MTFGLDSGTIRSSSAEGVSMPIRAIIFDLDDTLLVEVASARAAFLATCALAEERHGIDATALHETLRARARELWRASPTHPYCLAVGISSWEGLWGSFVGDDANLQALRAWAPEYRLLSWSRALRDHGLDDPVFAQLLADTFPQERMQRHVVFPDALPVLEALRPSYRFGLATNGAPGIQREKIRGSKLGAYFDAIAISGDVGVGKPDPAVFRHVLDGLGVEARQAVMVGNSLRSDVCGGQEAGMQTVWVNREGKPGDLHVRPDWEVKGLDELPRCLAEAAAG